MSIHDLLYSIWGSDEKNISVNYLRYQKHRVSSQKKRAAGIAKACLNRTACPANTYSVVSRGNISG